MKRILFSMILITVILSATLTGFMVEEKLTWSEDWPKKIRIGAAPIGGGYYMGASTLANVLKKEFPELEIIVEQTKAAIHNTKLINANEVEFAMCDTAVAYEGWNGKGPFDGIEQKGLRIFMVTWPNPVTFVTLEKTGVTNIKDFSGKYSGLSKGSSVDSLTRKLVDTLDIKVEVINLGTTDSAQALKNGIISGYTIGHPNPLTQDLSIQTNVRILGVSGDDAVQFRKAHPEYTYPLTVPGGYYKGVEEPFESIGYYNILITRDDLPEDMIYTVLQAMYKHQDTIEATWPIFITGMELDYVKYLTAPIHKGSIKYYRELGAEIPEVGVLDE